ncbi:POC1 centriolar protein A [Orbilia oligospora]|uniref:POC1 centriolar protein A n=1 Tax=Orbilia oligospora TaxID=2813651 RepID=A0A7C8QD09_ORBOL|nr:POC1 centriolar protein A [Orbilia oligospora]
MTRCIDLLSDNDEGLKENMCLMGHPGMSRRELGKSTIKEKIPEDPSMPVAIGCITWSKARSGPVTDVAFSPDGKWLASASLDGKVGLWDTAIYCGGEKFKSDSWYRADDLTTHTTMIKTTKEHYDAGYGFGKAIYKIVFSPDGKQVASGARGGDIIVWDVRTGRLLNRFRGGTTSICNLQFCPGNDNSIQLIASRYRQPIATQGPGFGI